MAEQIAGREMDAEIAERVMGWVWMRSDVPPAGMSAHGVASWKWLVPAEAQRGSFPVPRGGETRSLQNLPHYSTSDASALEVLKKLAGAKAPCDVPTVLVVSLESLDWGDGARWRASVVLSDRWAHERCRWSDAAPTIALAACRAALAYCDWRDAQSALPHPPRLGGLNG